MRSLPERMSHKKVQFEVVAIPGLVSLFTHLHIFWIAGLLLAVIDLPDVISQLRRIAAAVSKFTGVRQVSTLSVEAFAVDLIKQANFLLSSITNDKDPWKIASKGFEYYGAEFRFRLEYQKIAKMAELGAKSSKNIKAIHKKRTKRRSASEEEIVRQAREIIDHAPEHIDANRLAEQVIDQRKRAGLEPLRANKGATLKSETVQRCIQEMRRDGRLPK